ncbi:cadherin-related family member 4 isoform X3 [Xenopus tropicalis]|uniref:Cadherin-related family member 4 isoform X3 n=1 Tax=Xenopus tropicalis TaxID=8364 RepID=A0A8J1JGI0_XENTR|nr:cadherin-related family member 4 isoform X3 [Xenopus tropicalis]
MLLDTSCSGGHKLQNRTQEIRLRIEQSSCIGAHLYQIWGHSPLNCFAFYSYSFRWSAHKVNFVGLPVTVTLPQSSPQGTLVYNFTLDNCGSTNPTVIIDSVSPSTTFFNNPTLTSLGSTAYGLQITLSSSVDLNAYTVNQYTLNITATCGNVSVDGQLFVKISSTNYVPQCEPGFSSQAGDTVQVYSNVPASSVIYTVALRQPNNAPVTYRMTQPFPPVFTISSNGEVMAPAAGFTNALKTYQLKIQVIDSLGINCTGTLNVNVLPVNTTFLSITMASKAVTITENGGPNYFATVMQATGSSNIVYEMITPTTAYYIESGTGTIRTTYNLDLEKTPGLAFTTLQVRAYDMYQRSYSAIATVNITVLDVNDIPPSCSPAVFTTEVPETTPINQLLASFTCTDPDVNSTKLTYSIIPNAYSLYSFRMSGSQLLVNQTLTYDSAAIASVNFQYAATVVVSDGGSPPLTTNIPVFVTVTPVNQYSPVCNGPYTFFVNENAPFGTVVGQVNATDADYKFNNVEFSIQGGTNPPVFYINPRNGEINLLGPLDYETTTSYSLNIQVVDLNDDIIPDPINQKTTFCTITINVQDYNDNPPFCTPPYYMTTIYSTLSTLANVQTVTCNDKDPTSVLSYTIVGGNINNRFYMLGNTVRHNLFSYNNNGVFDPLTFELLVLVTDSTNPPQYSTTATVIVNVIPWTTTQPTTTSTTTTPQKQTRIVNGTVTYWQPDVWFMVVLTITGVLLLGALSLLAWKLTKGCTVCSSGAKDATQPLLQDSSFTDVEKTAEAPKEPPPEQPPNKEKKDIAPLSPLSLQFDGRAQDPVTGREYLFNSHTGERRWL